MKIHPETAALAVLVFASVGAAFWLTDTMMKDRARDPHDPLPAVVAHKPALTNDSPGRTNEPAPWLSDPVLQQRAALSVGVSFGYEAARRGAGPADILKLKDAFESHRLAIVEDWFATHPTPTR